MLKYQHSYKKTHSLSDILIKTYGFNSGISCGFSASFPAQSTISIELNYSFHIINQQYTYQGQEFHQPDLYPLLGVLDERWWKEVAND